MVKASGALVRGGHARISVSLYEDIHDMNLMSLVTQ